MNRKDINECKDRSGPFHSNKVFRTKKSYFINFTFSKFGQQAIEIMLLIENLDIKLD